MIDAEDCRYPRLDDDRFITLPNIFDAPLPSPDLLTPEEQEAELEKERQAFMMCCGSCLDFVSFHATAGFCKSEENGCLCKNPKAMKDMFDPKCERWKLNEESI